ncbi:MAG: hypothetical protein K0S68_651 [Candidatus Saccharibacteria bacterium]|nr:hypothetical protein [Candidatus Saccharibacteria bacterium]
MPNSKKTVRSKATSGRTGGLLGVTGKKKISRGQLLAVIALVVAIGGYVVFKSLAATSVGSLEAEAMIASGAQIIDDSAASGAKGLKLTTAAPATGTLTTIAPGTSVAVRAKAVACQGNPTVKVMLDGQQVLLASVSSSSWTTLSVSLPVAQAEHAVSIALSNPLEKRKCVRQLLLDEVQVLGSPVAATPTPTPSPEVTPGTSTAPTPEPIPSGFITTSGTNFIKDGQTFKFHGFNSYGMAGCYNGTPYTTTQLDAYFSSLPSNGVTRLWAFRTYGTDRIKTIVDAAARHNQHLILTLADGISSCGELDYAVNGTHSGKTLAYYQSGWKNEWLTWVRTIVPIFKDNPTVMMWETINEPGQRGAIPDLATWQAYFQGTSDAIRALDPNHIISVGANAPGNFGGVSNYNTLMATTNINAVSFHDYAYQYEGGKVVSNNFNVAKAAGVAANKPYYGGEAGQLAGASGCAVTPASRAAYMKAKADAYFAGGIGGLNYWEYAPSRASWVPACAHEMYPGDPIINQVKNYVTP